MNNLDLCLQVVSRSRQPLLYMTLTISETVRDRGSKGSPIGNGIQRIRGITRYALYKFTYLLYLLYMGYRIVM